MVERIQNEQHIRIFTDREKKQLSGFVFEGLDLERVEFKGANLRKARFVRANLRHCDFAGADLSGAGFIDCDLRGASLVSVVLSETSFRGSLLIRATGLSGDQRAYVHAQGGAVQPWHVRGGRSEDATAPAG